MEGTLVFSRFVTRARTMHGLQISSKVLQWATVLKMYSWSVSDSVGNIGRVRIFLIDHPGVRAEAGLVTKPFAIEAVVIDRSVMHVRADADRLEMIESAVYGKAKSSIHRIIKNSINDPSLVVAARIT
jgi:hypothetical protein